PTQLAGLSGLDDTGVIFVPKCFCILSRWNFSAFRELLTELYRISLSPSPLPLERFITNFASEVPLPPAGKLEVQYAIGSVSLYFKRPPKNRRVSALDLPFHTVFECLSLPSILFLFRCVLLDRKIILVSSQVSLLTCTSEVLISIMYPFTWQHTYIPVLPKVLMESIESPVPFLVGMSADDYEQVADRVPTDVVVVLIDKNSIIAHPGFTLPPLPPHQGQKLVRTLEQCADAYSRRGPHWQLQQLPRYDEAFTFAARPDDIDDAVDGTGVDDDEYVNSDDDEKMVSGMCTAPAASTPRARTSRACTHTHTHTLPPPLSLVQLANVALACAPQLAAPQPPYAASTGTPRVVLFSASLWRCCWTIVTTLCTAPHPCSRMNSSTRQPSLSRAKKRRAPSSPSSSTRRSVPSPAARVCTVDTARNAAYRIATNCSS
ncbi:hypothetical protein EON62_00310, partial [archaeon]